MRCSSWEHQTEAHKNAGVLATGTLKCAHKSPDGELCGQPHSQWVHRGAIVNGVTTLSTSAATEVTSLSASIAPRLRPALFEVVCAPITSSEGGASLEATILIDPGSDTDFIRQDVADKIGLVGEEITM